MPAPHPYLRLFAPLFGAYVVMLVLAAIVLTWQGIAISLASVEKAGIVVAVVIGLIGAGHLSRSAVGMLAALSIAGFVGMLAPLSILSYALTSLGAPFPLQDALFAQIDQIFGIDWLALVALFNQSPRLIGMLEASYHYTIFGMIYALVFLNVIKRPDRVLELFWGTVITCVVIGIIAALLPAIGAYPYYAPPQDVRSAISATSGIWHLEHFHALRNGTFTEFDLNKTEGLVTFPSFHTAMALLIPLSMRGHGAITAAAWAFALTVMVSTVPIGGHHVVDVAAGALITVITLRWLARVEWNRHGKINAVQVPLPQAHQPG